MPNRCYNLIVMLLLLLWGGSRLYGQEAAESISHAEHYLESRTASLDQYLKRSGRIQQNLLKKLKRREARLEKRLAKGDSATYAQYKAQKGSYDSISKLATDSSLARKNTLSRNPLMDSLKGIQSFISSQSSKLGAEELLQGKGADYTGKLSSIQQQLQVQQQVKDLVQQRTKSLEQMAGAAGIPGLKGIQQKVYYAGEKMKAWRELADDPDEAEEQALEYLQGTEGFSSFLNQNGNAFGGLGPNATAEDLQKAGFQTKKMMNSMLQEKLGSNLGAVQKNMAAQVQQYSDKLHGVTDKVKEVKSGINEAKQNLQEVKQAGKQLKQTERPGFRKNPERGKPFLQRFQVTYNFQTSRASANGLKPVIADWGAGLAFKHSPRLSYGLGLSLSTGLGQSWQQIKLSYEGISTRVYADWKWQYGISIQAGYERTFRPPNRPYLEQNEEPVNNNNNNNNNNNLFHQSFGGRQQAAYAGLMKRYRINSKWQGTFLLAYNVLWRQEGLRSPIILRLGWE